MTSFISIAFDGSKNDAVVAPSFSDVITEQVHSIFKGAKQAVKTYNNLTYEIRLLLRVVRK
jgi:hypothetical protein